VRYLLDTCMFIWLSVSHARISARAAAAFSEPDAERFITDASILELTIKHSAGRLRMPDMPRRRVPKRLRYFDIRTIPIRDDCIFRSGELPRVHSDPFDRLIAAHAIAGGFTILSPDVPLSLLGASRIW